MKLVAFTSHGIPGTGRIDNEVVHGRLTTDPRFPGHLDDLIQRPQSDWRAAVAASLSDAPLFPLDAIQFSRPFTRSNKILCVGLNYRDHTHESGYQQPDYPTVFTRFTTTLTAHLAPIVRPKASSALDFEGELVAVIGLGGRHITRQAALSHVAGYSIFNDASVRDFQHRTPQWTLGKNFDFTGAFGPAFVTADELPLREAP